MDSKHRNKLVRTRLENVLQPTLKKNMVHIIDNFYDKFVFSPQTEIESEYGRFIAINEFPEPCDSRISYQQILSYQKFFNLVDQANRYLPVVWQIIAITEDSIITSDVKIDINKFLAILGVDVSYFLKVDLNSEIVKFMNSYDPFETLDKNQILKLFSLEYYEGVQKLLKHAKEYIIDVLNDKYEQINNAQEIVIDLDENVILQRYNVPEKGIEWVFSDN